MDRVINYFFDEEEKDLVEDYKLLLKVAVVSFVITVFVIL